MATSNQFVQHWVESSDDDLETVEWLLKGKRYMHALFFGHLLLEKLFKAIYAKVHPNEPIAPKIHNLIVLAENCSIELSTDMRIKLSQINKFNIDGRYKFEKDAIYQICTKEFADDQIKIIKEIRNWLKEKLTSK